MADITTMGIFNFKQRKKLIKLRRWFKRRFDPTEEELSNEQLKAFKIAKKLIVDSTSFLYADLSRERLIIVNDSRFVRITNGKIRIIDGPFKYDVAYDVRMLDPLKELFAKNLEHRHDRIEAEIGSRVEKSLDHILKDINETQNEG